MDKKLVTVMKWVDELAVHGTEVLVIPPDLTTSTKMKCACGHEFSSSINVKRRGIPKLSEGEKLHCQNCGIAHRGPKKTDKTYPEIKEEFLTYHNIELPAEKTGATKDKHRMHCLSCGHKFEASIVSVRQSLKKYGTSGCPSCASSRRHVVYNQIQEAHIESIESRGYEVLTKDYTGQANMTITLQHKECGTTFDMNSTTALYGHIKCPVCSR